MTPFSRAASLERDEAESSLIPSSSRSGCTRRTNTEAPGTLGKLSRDFMVRSFSFDGIPKGDIQREDAVKIDYMYKCIERKAKWHYVALCTRGLEDYRILKIVPRNKGS